VAFRVLKTLYYHNPVSFYLLRVSGFFNAARHIGRNVMALRRYLMKTYREREGITSPARRRFSFREAGVGVRKLLGILSPFYDPARKNAPKHLDDVLSSV
jgi:hypothetical protein